VGQNIFRAQHRRHHGVIPIIIFVHGVAPDKVQARITRLQALQLCFPQTGREISSEHNTTTFLAAPTRPFTPFASKKEPPKEQGLPQFPPLA